MSSASETQMGNDKRASVFCNLINVSPAKDVWLSPETLKKRIDDIFTADGDTNIPSYAHQVTTEDVIICIKYLETSLGNKIEFLGILILFNALGKR